LGVTQSDRAGRPLSLGGGADGGQRRPQLVQGDTGTQLPHRRRQQPDEEHAGTAVEEATGRDRPVHDRQMSVTAPGASSAFHPGDRDIAVRIAASKTSPPGRRGDSTSTTADGLGLT
jgi:hypothetical protein